ncbi:MAG: hypothetical protein M1423_04265 [Acidobacteria bacterium]|nr:hypothetical protein [Acidobacteriota bacterium]
METLAKVTCTRGSWQKRDAYVMENNLIRFVALTGGGHIAEIRFRNGLDLPTLNPLWVPPWKTMEPYQYKEKIHAAQYGKADTGKLICGIAGHNLCLDYFGAASPEEVKQGLSIHGEAPSARWRATRKSSKSGRADLEMAVHLPVAGLQFTRQITIRQGESVVYLKEKVINEKKADHFFHWTQHVTLSPPFLKPRHCRTFLPGSKGRTFPHGYDEGKALLVSSHNFEWPFAPGVSGAKVDLTRPFAKSGRGILATVLLRPDREVAYVAALNTEENLLMGYCFKRADFPWVALWEENCARTDAPWNEVTQSRGLEFGSTPFPVGKREAFANGPLFGAPHFSMVPAKGQKTVNYLAFLAVAPKGLAEIRDINIQRGKIVVEGQSAKGKPVTLEVRASGLRQGSLA